MSGTVIAPWLAVPDAGLAAEFYAAALGATELYRLDGDDGSLVLAQLDAGGAPFWIQADPASSPPAPGRSPVRMVLRVDDPDRWFDRAVEAGATPVAGIHEEHGWRTGRVHDPFGHDWEFSRPTA
ncbi:MAG: PhnB protein [Cryptosporangiaceae bacterium]|jgi:PhnB protein|nr:PhnB protein [Cryptosporangiaceae bacterium]